MTDRQADYTALGIGLFLVALFFALFFLLPKEARGQDSTDRSTVTYVEGDESHQLDSLAFYGERPWPDDSKIVRGLRTYELGAQGGSLYEKLGFPHAASCVSRTGANMTLRLPKAVLQKLSPGDSLVATDKTWTLCVGRTAVTDTSTGTAMTLWGQQDMTSFGGPVYAGLEGGEHYRLHLLRDTLDSPIHLRLRTERYNKGQHGYSTDAIHTAEQVFFPRSGADATPNFAVGFPKGPSMIAYEEWSAEMRLKPEAGADSLYVTQEDTFNVVTELIGSYDSLDIGGASWHGARGDTSVVVNMDVRNTGTLFMVHGSVRDGRDDSVRVVRSYVVGDSGREFETTTNVSALTVLRRVRGDIDGDGAIDWGDMQSLFAYLFLGADVAHPDQLDVNGDNATDFRDAVELYSRL